jgi:hypothetical protein
MNGELDADILEILICWQLRKILPSPEEDLVETEGTPEIIEGEPDTSEAAAGNVQI